MGYNIVYGSAKNMTREFIYLPSFEKQSKNIGLNGNDEISMENATYVQGDYYLKDSDGKTNFNVKLAVENIYETTTYNITASTFSEIGLYGRNTLYSFGDDKNFSTSITDLINGDYCSITDHTNLISSNGRTFNNLSDVERMDTAQGWRNAANLGKLGFSYGGDLLAAGTLPGTALATGTFSTISKGVSGANAVQGVIDEKSLYGALNGFPIYGTINAVNKYANSYFYVAVLNKRL